MADAQQALHVSEDGVAPRPIAAVGGDAVHGAKIENEAGAVIRQGGEFSLEFRVELIGIIDGLEADPAFVGDAFGVGEGHKKARLGRAGLSF